MKKSNQIFASPLFREGFISQMKKLSQSYVLLTDSSVQKLWSARIEKELSKEGIKVLVISLPAGEKSKTRRTKERIEDQMLSKGLGRESALLALGGGVITDLGGFVAATYGRGIPLVVVPTSLLGMVDAAIGGKNGVNTAHGKNLIGTFYPPDLIGIDTSFLETLPKKQLIQGSAEVIKYGLTLKKSLFHDFDWKFTSAFLDKIVKESITIKTSIVEEDPEEKKGLRRVLNFGHTIGHALESAHAYRMPHGEAVAIGCLVESYLSYRLKYLSKESFQKIEEFFASSPFSFKISPKVNEAKIKEAMARDKKAKNGPRFVLIEEIGKVVPFKGEYCTAVPDKELNHAIDWMLYGKMARK
jgi:3-dehydroquinate synthase